VLGGVTLARSVDPLPAPPSPRSVPSPACWRPTQQPNPSGPARSHRQPTTSAGARRWSPPSRRRRSPSEGARSRWCHSRRHSTDRNQTEQKPTSSVRDLRWRLPMELRAVENRESGWETPGQCRRRAESAVMILHGFRGCSLIVMDSGCCPSAARHGSSSRPPDGRPLASSDGGHGWLPSGRSVPGPAG
jgi:hypothetical protein